MKVSQLNSELSELNSQLMIKEKELTKLKTNNKLLVRMFGGRKYKNRGERIPQVGNQSCGRRRINFIYINICLYRIN